MMKIMLPLLLLFSQQAMAAQATGQFDAAAFGQAYFDAWARSQRPGATAEDLEAYLSFLKDDVGHQHLPYDSDDSRSPDGKENMREGMTYYLGVHTEYSAELKDITVGHNVVILQYVSHAKGVHPDNGQTMVIDTEMVELLELEDERVSVIRKYSD